jgi:putative FmdB family regulatory protein
MPLYEYSCRQCDHSFEALVFDGESAECPECHGRRLERRWSVPAKPRAEASPVPMAGCDSKLPPCGPGCCRLE